MDRIPASQWVSIDARPEPIDIDLTRTAVIVVDMQNAFLSPGGMFDKAGYDISRAAVTVAANARLLPALREAGAKIVYLAMSYSADYADAGGAHSPNRQKELGLKLMRELPQYQGTFVTQGTWDEGIVDEIAPQPGDVVVRKQRYSGFAGTNLDLVLKTADIRFCLYTGVATNVCVESTLRDGFFLDYWPILVADACDNSGPPCNREASEWNVENAFGWVTTTYQVLRGIEAARA